MFKPKIELKLFPLLSEFCCDGCNPLRYRGAKSIIYLMLTGLNTENFEKNQEKTIEHVQHVMVEDRVTNLLLQ